MSTTTALATAAAAAAGDSAPTASAGQSLHAKGGGRLEGVNVLHLDPYRLPEGKIASLIDLAPTLYDFAGIEAPADLDGVSLRPLMDSTRSADADAQIHGLT